MVDAPAVWAGNAARGRFFCCGRPLGGTRWLIGKGIDWSGFFGRLLPAGAVLSPIALVAAVGGPLAGVDGALCGRAVLAAPLQTVAGAGRTFECDPVFGNIRVPCRWHFGPAVGRRGLPSSPRRRFAVAGIVGPGVGDVYGGSQLDHQRSQPVAGPARRRHPPGHADSMRGNQNHCRCTGCGCSDQACWRPP